MPSSLNANQTVLRLSFVLLLCISNVFCIKCFQCNSAEHPECADIPTNDTQSTFLKNCTGDYDGHEPFCRKVTHTILDVEEVTRVLRTCGWILNRTRENFCKKADTDFILEKNCQCFTDACNTSNRNAPFHLGFLIVATAVCGLLRGN